MKTLRHELPHGSHPRPLAVILTKNREDFSPSADCSALDMNWLIVLYRFDWMLDSNEIVGGRTVLRWAIKIFCRLNAKFNSNAWLKKTSWILRIALRFEVSTWKPNVTARKKKISAWILEISWRFEKSTDFKNVFWRNRWKCYIWIAEEMKVNFGIIGLNFNA